MLLFNSCYEDLGNYDYNDINEVSVEGVSTTFVVKKLELLEIEPELNFSVEGTENEFEYEWVIVSSELEDSKFITISTERNLSYEIDVPLGEYQLNYYVTNKLTNVQYITNTDLIVAPAIYEGWLLITDNNGDRNVDYIGRENGFNTDETIVKDAFSSTGMDLKGLHKIVKKEFYGSYTYYCLGEETYYWLEGKTMEWEPFMEAKNQILTDVKYPLKPKHLMWHNSRNNHALMILDNDLYVNHYWNRSWTYNGNFYNDTEFDVSEFVWDWEEGWNPVYYIYDKTNRRFMACQAAYNSLPNLTALEDDPDVSYKFNTGKDLIYTANYRFDDDAYALLKNPEDASGYELMRFNPFKNNGEGSGDSYDLSNTRINEASNYTVSLTRPFLYYTIKNTVFQFNFSTKELTEIISFEGESEITFIDFHKFEDYKYNNGSSTGPDDIIESELLCIGVNDQSKENGKTGSFYLYEEEKVNTPAKLYKEYHGLGKIIGVNFKEKN